MAKFKPPKFLSKKNLLRAATSYGCWLEKSRGKGSHLMVFRETGSGEASFPLPNHRTYGHDYIDRLRENLHLTRTDGVPDREFYLRARGKKK